MRLRFDVYGRYRLEVHREGEAWVAYRSGTGTNVPAADLTIPAELDAEEVEVYLADMLHELAEPGRALKRLS